MSSPVDGLAIVQGGYFLITGIWPLLHMRSFEAVTGPKTDDWLVRTVGVLVAVVGCALLLAGGRGEVTPGIFALGCGGAVGLLSIDVWYSLKGTISRIYLLDAAVEFLLAVAWPIALAI